MGGRERGEEQEIKRKGKERNKCGIERGMDKKKRERNSEVWDRKKGREEEIRRRRKKMERVSFGMERGREKRG